MKSEFTPYMERGGAVPSHVPAGATPSSRYADAQISIGGVPWADEPVVCSETTRAGEPCKAAPLSGQTICVGHSKRQKSE